MGARMSHRAWLAVGAAATAVLLTATWFLLIQPTRADTQTLGERAERQRTVLQTQQQELARLQEQQKRLPEYRRTLQRNRAALPADPGQSDFLRQLQNSDDEVGVEVTTVTAAEPVAQKGSPTVYALPITVGVEGSPAALGRWLDRLQRTQPRAVLVQSANLGSDDGSGRSTLTVTMQAFVAPPAGKTPAVGATG